MVQRLNPYFANAGQYQGIAEGLTNLGQAFLAGNDPVREAQGISAAYQARQARQEADEQQRISGLLQGSQQAFSNADLSDPAARQQAMQTFLANTVGTGQNYGNIGDVNLAAGGISPGIDESGLGQLFAGSGRAIGENQALSTEGREAVAARNFGNDQTLQQMRDQAAMQRQQASIAAANQRAAASRAAAAQRAASQGDIMATTALKTREGEIQSLMNTYGWDRQTAEGVREGLIEPRTDPVTGRTALFNVPGALSEQAGPPPSPEEVMPEGISTIPEGADIGATTGIGGAAQRGINTISDIAGFGTLFEEQPVAQGALQDIQRDIVAALAPELQSGRLSNQQMDLILQGLPDPSSITQGAGSATTQLQLTNERINRQLQQLTPVLQNPEQYSVARVGEAREQAQRLANTRANIETLTRGQGAPSSLMAPETAAGANELVPPPAGGPQPGAVEDGYRFLGGDPADPNNWEAM